MYTTSPRPKVSGRTDEIRDTAIVVVKNLERLVEAVALLIVAGFAIFAVYHYGVSLWFKYLLLTAGMVIGVRGSIEFLRHLAQRPIK